MCFLPGTLALGTLYGAPQWHLQLAEELIRTCVEMYNTKSGLAPEIVKFDSFQYRMYIQVIECSGTNTVAQLRKGTVQ